MTDAKRNTQFEEGYRTDGGNGTSSYACYSIEARCGTAKLGPITVNNQVFDGEWRTVNIARAPIGVPAAPPFMASAQQHGLYGYAAAQALRWWLLAEADMTFRALDTRLIEHRLETTYKITATAIVDELSES